MSVPLALLVRLPVGDRRSFLARQLRVVVAVASIGLFGLFAVAPPASADGGGETNEGYLLVQQALGHLAHDTSSGGIDLAMEKVEDALATEDQDGVAVADVEQAERALEAGRAGHARALLQGSIRQALSELGLATGEQTGTTVVAPPLPGREALTGRDWGFLAASMVFLLAGMGLALRFRPRDTIGELRQRLGASRTAVDDRAGSPTEVEREI